MKQWWRWMDREDEEGGEWKGEHSMFDDDDDEVEVNNESNWRLIECKMDHHETTWGKHDLSF